MRITWLAEWCSVVRGSENTSVAWLWPRFGKGALLTRSCARPPLIWLRLIVWLPSTSGTTSSQPAVAAAYATYCCGAARATGSARGGAGFAFRSTASLKSCGLLVYPKLGVGIFPSCGLRWSRKNKVVLFKSRGFYSALSDCLGGQQEILESAQMKWNIENVYFRGHLAVKARKVFV